MLSLTRLRRLVLPSTVLATTLATVLAGSLALASPASADVTGTTSSGDVVLYRQCQHHPIAYRLEEEAGLLPLGWRLELQVFTPAGLTSEGTVLNSATNPPLTGSVDQLFCGSEPAGTWTVKGVVRSAAGDALSPDLPQSSFTVRAPYTRTSLKKRHLGPRTNRLVTKVQLESPDGWARANGVTMRLERSVGDTWQPVRRVVLTATRGKASTVVKGRGTYRVVVPASNNLGGSQSRAVSVR